MSPEIRKINLTVPLLWYHMILVCLTVIAGKQVPLLWYHMILVCLQY